jgi:4-amino-4-deoxy-L-arabinose transferase-like glycosyltransferase
LLLLQFFRSGWIRLARQAPIALWLQVASAKMLGFNAFNVMLPQVLEGVVSVALLHHTVGRRFGRTAALLAALFLALTPISAAIDRSNNTDSCLIMVLLFAAWALIRAAETGSGGLLMLALALVGIGFNVKMAVALAVAPTFGLVYLYGAPGLSVRTRLVHLGLAAVVMAAVSLSWVTAFDLTPPAERPYAGSTMHNSMLELALLHNGLDRFIPRSSGDTASPGSEAAGAAGTTPDAATRTAAPSGQTTALWDRTPAGPLRLATPHLAAQMGWWLPMVVAGVALGGSPWRWRRRLSAAQAHVLVWAGWAFTYAIAFSLAGGVFHTYYVAVLGPPLAAMAGIGASLIWQRCRAGALPRALPAVLLITAAWHAYIELGNVAWQFEGWHSAMLVGAVGVLLLAAVGMWNLPPQRAAGRLSTGLMVSALLARLVMPAAWALSTVLVRPNVAAPAADITKLSDSATDVAVAEPPETSKPRSRKLLEFLGAHRQSERYLLAVPNALQAAPLIVRTGEPIMAMGGYLGRDPILTPSQLECMVEEGELRYVIVGGPSIVPPDTRRERVLAYWIRSHGQRVDPALWREAPDPSRPTAGSPRRPRAVARLYDLRPDQPGAQPEVEGP